MTSYHVLASDELLANLDPAMLPSGFRFAEQEPTDPARYPGMHWWLVEDDEADPSLEGKRVEITIMRGRMSEDDLYDQTRITERRVVG